MLNAREIETMVDSYIDNLLMDAGTAWNLLEPTAQETLLADAVKAIGEMFDLTDEQVWDCIE